jgi:hypothetical protein
MQLLHAQGTDQRVVNICLSCGVTNDVICVALSFEITVCIVSKSRWLTWEGPVTVGTVETLGNDGENCGTCGGCK